MGNKKRLRVRGISEVSDMKRDIQDLVRQIVIRRDGGCIFRFSDWHKCSGYAADGHLILQADHLITRSNSATYADTRLIVCVCKGLHGWKKWNEAQYNLRVEMFLPPDRLALWKKAQADRYKPVRTGAYDWGLQYVALRQELAKMSEVASMISY